MQVSLLQWYMGLIFKLATLVDGLVMRPPLSSPDDPEASARELLHRMTLHFLACRLWRAEWLVLTMFSVVSVLAFLFVGDMPIVLGVLFGLIVAGVVFVGAPLLIVRPILRSATIAAEFEAAAALTRRVCLREIPSGTPEDLADPWRHGWLTADGRPVASEILEYDLRRIDAMDRARSLMIVALSAGLIPIAATPIGAFSVLAYAVIVLLKWRRDPSPAAVRARLLDAAAANIGEGAAWTFAGGAAWAARIEGARRAQMAEATRDRSPMIGFGLSLGVMASRGDFFAPSRGLSMRLSLRDLMTHLLVLGGTGAGKTAGVLRPVCQQIGALNGVGLFLLDGKGSFPGEMAGIVPDLRNIDPSTTCMSLVEGLTPTEIVGTIVDILGNQDGGKDAAFFVTSGAGLLRHSAVLARQIGGAAWSLTGIYRLACEGPDEAVLENVDLKVPEVSEAVQFFTSDWPKLDTEVKSSIIATVRAWVTTITGHPDMLAWANCSGPGDVDITSPLRGARLGVLAPAHRYGQAGPVAVALLKQRLFSAIRDRADRGMQPGETPVVLVMDEAQDVVTKQDASMLAIARSLNLAVVAATQTIEGIEARLGEKDSAQWLTLFGSVIALANRSARTAEIVARRVGHSFRPVLESVPGVPTVRGAVSAQRAAGRLAAARTQPLVAGTVAIGEGSGIGGVLSAINPFQLASRTVKGEQGGVSSRIGAAPIVTGDELTELLVEPNTALALFTRGRVPRRDIIALPSVDAPPVAAT